MLQCISAVRQLRGLIPSALIVLTVASLSLLSFAWWSLKACLAALCHGARTQDSKEFSVCEPVMAGSPGFAC